MLLGVDVPGYPHMFCNCVSLCPVTFPSTSSLAHNCFTLALAAGTCSWHSGSCVAKIAGLAMLDDCPVIQCAARLRSDVSENASSDGCVSHISSVVSCTFLDM